MSEQAIANRIYSDRIAKAQAELDRQGVDFLVVGPSSDLFYLLGHPARTSERLKVAVIPRQGQAFVVVPTLEAPGLAERQDLVDLRRWDDTANPIDLFAAGIGDARGKTIAVGDQLWSVFLLRMQAACPGAQFVSGAGVLKELRVIKSADELDLLREAGRRTDDAWAEFIESATLAGRTETEVARHLAGLMEEHGLGAPAFMIVASGPGSASPHHHTGERRIEEGDSVVFDFGGNIQGYKSDITRTVHVGEPPDEYRRVYDVVNRAREAAFAAVRPGAPCESVDAAAREVITQAGYGEYFIHRVGHGLGLDVHEEPYMVGGNAEPLRAGMVFSDEPGIYIPGRFGIRIEDAVACTETGGEFLNHATHELIVMH
ncbi:MAG TPA: Xaa-Pro peptidase family protein [Thermomicrobiales bacterium]|nr:Xaa-Pro peptidase family protein [Thermomicrobiales bacterium]